MIGELTLNVTLSIYFPLATIHPYHSDLVAIPHWFADSVNCLPCLPLNKPGRLSPDFHSQAAVRRNGAQQQLLTDCHQKYYRPL